MILEAVGREKLFEITANTAMAGAMSGTSMLWIKRNLPEVYEKTKYFGHVNTLLAQRMSGNFAIDYSNASYTDLFETTGGFQWSEVLCEKIGIDMEKLPPLHASTDVVGGLIHPDLIRMGKNGGKSISYFGLVAMGIGCMLGTSWLLLTGTWLETAGGPLNLVVAFVLCILIELPFAFAYMEAIPMLPLPGGEVVV